MKEKFIEVYDDIIPEKISNEIESSILISQRIPLYYTANIADKDLKEYAPGLGNVFYDPPANRIESFSSFFTEVLYRFCSFRNIYIQDIFQSRLFLHLPSPNPGLDGIHKDLSFKHYVCLYYINNSEGDTVFFKDDKKTEIKRVSPKKGRIAFFDGSINHCSSRPTSQSRSILNFNFLAKEL